MLAAQAIPDNGLSVHELAVVDDPRVSGDHRSSYNQHSDQSGKLHKEILPVNR